MDDHADTQRTDNETDDGVDDEYGCCFLVVDIDAGLKRNLKRGGCTVNTVQIR